MMKREIRVVENIVLHSGVLQRLAITNLPFY